MPTRSALAIVVFVLAATPALAEGWVDVVQDGAMAPSTAHTGDAGCPGLRKSVRFTLAATPATIEISNAPADHIEIAVTPAK